MRHQAIKVRQISEYALIYKKTSGKNFLRVEIKMNRCEAKSCSIGRSPKCKGRSEQMSILRGWQKFTCQRAIHLYYCISLIALLSATNSATLRVSPRRVPSISHCAKADCTRALSSCMVFSALFSVLRRWPNAAFTSR